MITIATVKQIEEWWQCYLKIYERQYHHIEWHEHLSQMEQQRIARIMFHKPIGYRDIGHPRRRWEDTF
jgi:hypothetical protein